MAHAWAHVTISIFDDNIQYNPLLLQTILRHTMSDGQISPILKPAEDNPWYLLATLYGAPKWISDETLTKNRVAWNRFYARGQDVRNQYNSEKNKIYNTYTPFDQEEMENIRIIFAKRTNGRFIELPRPSEEIDFRCTIFCEELYLYGYIFTNIKFCNSVFLKNVHFNRSIFFGHSSFCDTSFSHGANFREVKFLEASNFSKSRFAGFANFKSVNFSTADFRKANFCGEANYEKSKFDGHAKFMESNFFVESSFKDTKFNGSASFDKSIFDGNASFIHSTFKRGVSYRNAAFSKYADFCMVTFSGHRPLATINVGIIAEYYKSIMSEDADFSHTSFSGNSYFINAVFCSRVIFTNSEFKASTDFQDCCFGYSPPQFSGAKLHEGTVWRGVSWPPPPSKPEDVGLFTDAYERLKLEMDRLKKHEDELMFFAKELECRRGLAGWFRGLPIAGYGCLCGYGQSYLKPLMWLFALFFVGIPTLWLLQADLEWPKAVGLSAVNCLASLGIRKDLMGKTMDSLGTGALIVSGVQTVLGLILLFLIGLGLRNRFRMK